MNVRENSQVIAYLKKRGLVAQYLKAKSKLEADNFLAVDLKKRKPKSSSIWYFRINQKYRALAERKGDILFVFHISDHQ